MPEPPPVPSAICEIQGPGLLSPLAGQAVTVTDDVVTALAPDGFFIQSPADCDGDPASSDGLFVFTGAPPAVAVGDQVSVSGTVQEFFELTEIGAATIEVLTSGNPLPAPIRFDEDTPSPDQPQPDTELERFEGMIVRFVDAVATGPSDAFGDVPVVAKPAPVFREPGIAFPGLPELPVWDGNPEIFELDPDGLGLPDADVYRGQAIVECEGPLSFAFGDYTVLPKRLVLGPEPDLPRPVRDRQAGEHTVASLNLLRFFDEFDDPDTDDEVEDPLVVEERLDRFSRYIREVLKAPDVLAVQEAENLELLERLAGRIALDAPAVAYEAILREGNDIGGIDVGFLVRDSAQVLSTVQFYEDLEWVYGGEPTPLFDRPPLGLVLRLGGTFPLVVLNNHLRSLGGIDDPADGDRVRQKRRYQAGRVSLLVKRAQSLRPGVRLVLTGDLNAFEFTDGYVDVLGQLSGDPDPLGALLPVIDVVEPNLANELARQPAPERYSFVFEGSAQVLDHMLTSVGLQPFVSGIERPRGNADAPERFAIAPPPGGPALAVSDHDAVVLYIATQGQ